VEKKKKPTKKGGRNRKVRAEQTQRVLGEAKTQ
jgi:hypothetical protein